MFKDLFDFLVFVFVKVDSYLDIVVLFFVECCFDCVVEYIVNCNVVC